MIHIYTGNGKGKTTAAVGLAVRALGSGMSVCFCQFMKDGSSSEIAMLRKLGADVRALPCCDKFTWEMSSDELEVLGNSHNELLKSVTKCAPGCMIVLDEFIGTYNADLVDRELADEVIREISADHELVLTGRDAPKHLVELADYVTNAEEIKHPFNDGKPARKGIEY